MEFLLFFARERGVALLVTGFASPLLVVVVFEFVTVVLVEVVVVDVVVALDVTKLVLVSDPCELGIVTAESLQILSSLICLEDPFSILLEVVVEA